MATHTDLTALLAAAKAQAQDAVDGLVVIESAHATGSFSGLTLVLHSELAQQSSDPNMPGFTVPVSVCTAIDEAAADYGLEFLTQRQAAESAFWLIHDRWLKRPSSLPRPWRHIDRLSKLGYDMRRVDRLTLCTTVQCLIRFRITQTAT